MDFIERIFHIAPDGGTGLLELAFVLILIGVPFVGVVISGTSRRNQRPGR